MRGLFATADVPENIAMLAQIMQDGLMTYDGNHHSVGMNCKKTILHNTEAVKNKTFSRKCPLSEKHG